MELADVVAFLRAHKFAVEATVHPSGAPQAAVVGVVITDACELFFDTFTDTRKYANLVADPRVAFVVWSDDGRTVQIEGVADFPRGDELAALYARYVATFPDGAARRADPRIAYVRVRPTWIRSSDFRVDPPSIVEGDAAALAGRP